MTAIHFLKKTACWTTVFLCILSISRVSVLLGSQSDGTIPGTVQRVKVTAGWYGTRHHKKLTANGQRFNMHKNTLAHRTLPFGTKVRLVTLDNKKSAEGVVNDRGPYSKGRDLDVSYSMAKQLGFVRKGVVKLYLSQLEDQDLHN
ncbi:MAG: septal ring lytic transglycosylase RlpA family protein [Thermodesulfobacteriota bacterium]